MKILLVSQNFYPENFKSNDIAFELVKKGHAVDALVGIPNYPEGKYFPGYSLLRRRIETINGVNIYRSFQTPRGRNSNILLAINYLSFAIFASIWAFFFALVKNYDVIIVHGTSPITQGIPAVIIKKLNRVPLYYWVLDLWPESLISAGGIKSSIILNIFERIVRLVYNNSDKILISSKSFESSIIEKGDFKNKLVYFPNWAEDAFCLDNQMNIPNLPDGFKILFAGNIGEAQDFSSIMQAALLMKNEKGVKWVIVGDGRKKSWVDQFIKDYELQDTVITLGRFPINCMPSFFKKADALLVTLKDELIFNLTVPAKVQAYMASSCSILAMLNGEGANIIKESKCGYVVDSGDYKSLVSTIREKVIPNKEKFSKMGILGNTYYKSNFSKEKCILHLCEIIEPK